MTDMQKFMKLFDELGIKYKVIEDTLYFETEVDGAQAFGISFWDGEDFPKGKFHEFWVDPEVD